MGGAIFNHRGSVGLLNVTATSNVASGGPGMAFGSGLGAVLFNLNGSVTIDFSTLAGNTLSGNNTQADSKGPEDGTVYSLAYGNKIEDASASSMATTSSRTIFSHRFEVFSYVKPGQPRVSDEGAAPAFVYFCRLSRGTNAFGQAAFPFVRSALTESPP